MAEAPWGHGGGSRPSGWSGGDSEGSYGREDSLRDAASNPPLGTPPLGTPPLGTPLETPREAFGLETPRSAGCRESPGYGGWDAEGSQEGTEVYGYEDGYGGYGYDEPSMEVLDFNRQVRDAMEAMYDYGERERLQGGISNPLESARSRPDSVEGRRLMVQMKASNIRLKQLKHAAKSFEKNARAPPQLNTMERRFRGVDFLYGRMSVDKKIPVGTPDRKRNASVEHEPEDEAEVDQILSKYSQRLGRWSVSEQTRWAKLFAAAPVFQDLERASPGIIWRISSSVRVIREGAGQVLFRQGDPPKNCYLILSGEVSIHLHTDPGKNDQEVERAVSSSGQVQRAKTSAVLSQPGKTFLTVEGWSHFASDSDYGNQVAVLRQGQVFGERALLNKQHRAATIKCATDCEFLVITQEDFGSLIGEQNDFTRSLFGMEFFRDLEKTTPGVLGRLCRGASLRTEKKGQILFRQDDQSGNCYVVVSGKVGCYAMKKFEQKKLKDEGYNSPRCIKGSELKLLPSYTEVAEEEERKEALNKTTDETEKAALIYKHAVASSAADFEAKRSPSKEKDGRRYRTTEGHSSFTDGSLLGDELAIVDKGGIVGERALDPANKKRAASVRCLEDCLFLVLGPDDYRIILENTTTMIAFFDKHMASLGMVGSFEGHPSSIFADRNFPRGHVFTTQGIVAEPALYVVAEGSVELRRCGPGEDPATQFDTCCSDEALWKHIVDRSTVSIDTVEAGGAFCTLPFFPLVGEEAFTVSVSSEECKIYYVANADIERLPKDMAVGLRKHLCKQLSMRILSLEDVEDCDLMSEGVDSGWFPSPGPSRSASVAATPFQTTGMGETTRSMNQSRRSTMSTKDFKSNMQFSPSPGRDYNFDDGLGSLGPDSPPLSPGSQARSGASRVPRRQGRKSTQDSFNSGGGKSVRIAWPAASSMGSSPRGSAKSEASFKSAPRHRKPPGLGYAERIAEAGGRFVRGVPKKDNPFQTRY